MVIYTFSKAIDKVEILSLFQVFSEEKAYFCNQSRSFEVFLAGKLLKISGSIQELKKKSRNLFSEVVHFEEPIQPILLGGVLFDTKLDKIWKNVDGSSFILYGIQISKKNSKWFLSINHIHEKKGNQSLHVLKNELMSVWKNVEQKFTETIPKQKRKYGVKIEKKQCTPDKETWKSNVKLILRKIQQNSVLKVVLSRKLEILLSKHSVFGTFENIRENNQGCFVFFIEMEDGKHFVGASPELLIQKVKNKIRTMALAGSIQRAKNAEEDAKNQRTLLESSKDLSEHKIVVDMIRNTLFPYTKALSIEKNPRLLKLSYIHHLKTEITGEVNSGIDIFTLLEKLHPTPALGGMPRKKALTLISRLEGHARGWYGSPVGYIDSEFNGEFTVAIRSAVLENNKAHVYAGAGIVKGSDPEKEWEETEKKFQPILDAL